jgi:sialic acid synthase SpsE
VLFSVGTALVVVACMWKTISSVLNGDAKGCIKTVQVAKGIHCSAVDIVKAQFTITSIILTAKAGRAPMLQSARFSKARQAHSYQ